MTWAAAAAHADRQLVLVERFDSGLPPPGWEIVDEVGLGVVWEFDDPGDRGNLTGGSGGFAIVDSFFAEFLPVDTSLLTPSLDLTGVTGTWLEFDTHLNIWQEEEAEIADVDLSVDGGSSWSNIFRRVESQGDLQGFIRVPIPGADGQSSVQLRFHYYNAFFEFWWEVDNIVLAGVDPDEIFQDDFEGGTTSHWSARAG